MGSVIRLMGLPTQLNALGREVEAHRELADQAVAQAASEEDEADLQASAIRSQAQIEALAVSLATGAQVSSELYNARSAALNADRATIDANINEIQQRRENRRKESAQVARIATTGFNVEDFDDLIRTSAEEAAMDALLIRRDGQLANLDFAAREALALGRAADAEISGEIKRQNVLSIGESKARTALFTGRTRSRASQAAAVRARAGAERATSQQTLAVVDAGASVADDIVKIAAMA